MNFLKDRKARLPEGRNLPTGRKVSNRFSCYIYILENVPDQIENNNDGSVK